MELNTQLQTQPDEIQQQRDSGNFQDVPGAGGIDAAEFIDSILDNSHVPKPLRHQLWALFGKSTKLSALKDEDIRTILLEYELIRLTILESIPKQNYNEELELSLLQIGIELRLSLNRSRGGGRLTERELIGASSTATFSDRFAGKQSEDPGFLSKLANIFR